MTRSSGCHASADFNGYTRGGGAIATLDATTHPLIERRAVCPAPRGIAYQVGADVLWVACAGGELVTLAAAGGATRLITTLEGLRR